GTQKSWYTQSLIDRNGNQTVFGYDANGFVRTITDPRSRVTTYGRMQPSDCFPIGTRYLGQPIPPCDSDAFCQKYFEQGSPYANRHKAAVRCQNQLCVFPCGNTDECAVLEGSSFDPDNESCQNWPAAGSNVCTVCNSPPDPRIRTVTIQGYGNNPQIWTLNWDTQTVAPHDVFPQVTCTDYNGQPTDCGTVKFNILTSITQPDGRQ